MPTDRPPAARASRPPSPPARSRSTRRSASGGRAWPLSGLAGALVLTVAAGCALKSSREAAPASEVTWLAAGLGHCHALTGTARGSVIAACDRGVVEADVHGRTHTLHPTLTHDVSIRGDRLWVKLPDTLLWGDVPRAGTIFASTRRISLGTVEDLVATPDGRLLVATPGTLLLVSPDTGTITRYRNVPVPLEKLAFGAPTAEGGLPVLALAHDAVYVVEKKQSRLLLDGLTDVRAAVTLPDGRLVIASGTPCKLGVLAGETYTPLATTVEGLTDLIVHDPGTGPELWFSTDDGSIGRTPLP